MCTHATYMWVSQCLLKTISSTALQMSPLLFLIFWELTPQTHQAGWLVSSKDPAASVTHFAIAGIADTSTWLFPWVLGIRAQAFTLVRWHFPDRNTLLWCKEQAPLYGLYCPLLAETVLKKYPPPQNKQGRREEESPMVPWDEEPRLERGVLWVGLTRWLWDKGVKTLMTWAPSPGSTWWKESQLFQAIFCPPNNHDIRIHKCYK